MLAEKERNEFLEVINRDYPLILELISALDLEIQGIENTPKQNAIELAKWAFESQKEMSLLAFVEKIESRLKDKARTQKSVLYFVNEQICSLHTKDSKLEQPKIRLLV